mgnify:CR=1 FL=1
MSEDISAICPDLLAGFLDEAPEYLTILDEGLLAFEQKAGSEGISVDEPEDYSRMNEMFRAAHSFKGLGAALGFIKIRDLTHLMETLFDRIRMKQRKLDATVIEALFQVFDRLRALVTELADPSTGPVSIEDALQLLSDILDDDKHAESEPDVAQPQTSSSKTEAPVESEVLNDPELANAFIETTLETLDELNQALLKLEDTPDDLDLINSVFRFAHNLKGAVGVAGCRDLYRITHNMESVLDLVRSHTLTLSDDMMTAIFNAIDRIRADIKTLQAGASLSTAVDQSGDFFDQWLTDKTDATEASATEQASSEAEVGEPPSAERDESMPPTLSTPADIVVSVEFEKGSLEAPIHAYLIHNKLSELGEVTQTNPDVDSLDAGAVSTGSDYHCRTQASADRIKEILEMYAVSALKVTHGGASPSAAPAEPITAADSGPVESTPASTVPPKAQETAPTDRAPKAAQKSSEKSAQAEQGKAAPKIGETIRVDLERLDQLMNLGGELVINKARLVQIHNSVASVFQEQNLAYLVNDLSDRLGKLQDGINQLEGGPRSSRMIAELSDTIVSMSHDFGVVRGVMERVHDCRPAMNDFGEALHSLGRVSDGIQKGVMETRMVAVGPLFQRFRRVVRDISKATGKSVELVIHGEGTELDKRMIDELGDPLTHMIRNSVDHGIELPADRADAGKPETAQVTLNAYHRGRHICIEVKDDGRGVNTAAVRKKIVERQLATAEEVERMSEKEVVQYIFKPGFSTAEQVTDLSGRGMGMDIVMNKLDAINGIVEVDSVTGVGCTVTIKLPLTLAIVTAIIGRIGRSVYAIPLECVGEIITVARKDIQHIQRRKVVRVRDHVIPVALFEHIFDCQATELNTATRDQDQHTLIILNVQNDRLGLIVDELIGQEDVVIKSIADNYRNVPGITGASIMGDGTVSLILDVASMISMLGSRGNTDMGGPDCVEAARTSEGAMRQLEVAHAG